MKIVVDENIPFAREAFSIIGEVTLAHGRNLPDLNDTDVLIVRSITKVDERLLAGTKVKFVGTATIGFDHIDRAYLESKGIGFASAPGSNANSVAEYIVATLLTYAGKRGMSLEGKSIGVVGVGNVGSKVVRKCEALGMTVLKNDPPLKDATGDPAFLPLEEVIRADFVTLHTPLSREGNYPTYHLADRRFFEKMRGVFINSSRGKVVDETALKAALGVTVEDAMLDVWETEPDVDRELSARVSGTPHIAGYSYDGKVNGTQMMFDAVRSFFGLAAQWNAAELLPTGPAVVCSGAKDEDVLRDAVKQVYDIERDYIDFRDRIDEFDRLRKEYPHRREFPAASVSFEASPATREKLAGIGFRL